MTNREYCASEVRVILQELFPDRSLVLSQFTFFNHMGIARPTGTSHKRKRRCYRLSDVLPMATVLALKEEGIPLKNIGNAPTLIQEHLLAIENSFQAVLLSGFGESISLSIGTDTYGTEISPIDALLNTNENKSTLFWSFDISALYRDIIAISEGREHSRNAHQVIAA